MKRYYKLIVMVIMMLVAVNVEAACGDLSPKNVTINVSGYKVTKSGNTYTITLSKPVDEVYLSASPDVKGGSVSWYNDNGTQLGPRRVKTNTESVMKLRKQSCDKTVYGTFTYVFRFVVASNSTNNSNANNNTNNNTNNNANNNQQTQPQTETTPEPQSQSQSESQVQSTEAPKLSSIEVKGFDLGFKPDVYEYNLETSRNLKALDITTKAENSGDKVTISSNYKNLHSGVNTININVTNADNVVTKYVIKLNKKYQESDDATLKSLSIKGYNIEFSPDTYEYALTLKNGDTEFENIEAVPNSDKAKVTISGNKNLTSNSQVTINVTAEDGTEQDYIIYTVGEPTTNKYLRYIIYAAGILFIIFLLLLIITTSKKKKKKRKAKSEPAKEATSSKTGKKSKRKKARDYEGEGGTIKEIKPDQGGVRYVKNEPKKEIMPGTIVKNEPKAPATKAKQKYQTIEPNKDKVNVDEHLQIVKPDDVDEDLSKTEVFKM